MALLSSEIDVEIDSPKSAEAFRRFMWEVGSIYVYLEEIRRFQARLLGISEPQLTILMALADLDKEQGVPVNVVSKLLHVDPSFITTQSKLLEKKGLLRRKTSTQDARVVQMSLTDKTYNQFAFVVTQQEALGNFIFSEFNIRELNEFAIRLTSLKGRLQKASLKAALDS